MLTHDATLTAVIWQHFEPALFPALDAEDDIDLWAAAIGQIIADGQFLCTNAKSNPSVFTEIGRCSHWLRPHQMRWTADGGFAWPSGYGGSGYSLHGLPEFDWSLIWQWNVNGQEWQSTDKPSGKRRLQLRLAMPSRTARHDQAVIHTLWTPGCPTIPKQKVTQMYGFRKQDGSWVLTAYRCTNNDAYNCETST